MKTWIYDKIWAFGIWLHGIGDSIERWAARRCLESDRRADGGDPAEPKAD